MVGELSAIWPAIREQLEKQGIGLDALCEDVDCGTGLKVVCVGARLGDSLEAMGETARDQVVMVRIDQKTIQTLDAWVETGVVKSRSEAAALFIREGLKVRASELDELRSALSDVQEAKRKLREAAEQVLGAE